MSEWASGWDGMGWDDVVWDEMGWDNVREGWILVDR